MAMATVLLLICSNLFMTVAWYWHLKGGWSAGQLKVTQEAIALVIFGGFMVFVLKEPLHWRHLAAFGCIMAAVGFLFVGR